MAERLLGDERLAKLAGRGNGRAFGALYNRHHQALYRYCRSILGNHHDAQDALQSAMMRAYDALARQQRDLAVKPWLFRIAHNEAVTILRRRRPEQELASDLESVSADVESTLQTRERLAALVADLRSLPERQRAALVMRELSGLSIREIAAALSISEGAAKQTLFEARTSLHERSEGRAMQCEAVREAVSQGVGRILRGRRLKAHLSACEDCRAFRDAIGVRQADLRAIAPMLPVSAAGAILTSLLSGGGHQAAGSAISAGSSLGAGATGSSVGAATAGSSLGAGAAGAGVAGVGAASAGSGVSLAVHAAASVLVKGVAGIAVLAAATAGTVRLASSSQPTHRARTSPAKASATPTGATAPNAPAANGSAGKATAKHESATGRRQAGHSKSGESGASGTGRTAQLGGVPSGSKGLPAVAPHPAGSPGASSSNPRSSHRSGTKHGHAAPRRSGSAHSHRGSSHPGGGAHRPSASSPKTRLPSKQAPTSTSPQPTGKTSGEVQPPTVTQPRPAKAST